MKHYLLGEIVENKNHSIGIDVKPRVCPIIAVSAQLLLSIESIIINYFQIPDYNYLSL